MSKQQTIKVLKIGTPVTHTITGDKGTLTAIIINMDRSVQYGFQPKKLSKKTGRPVADFLVPAAQVSGAHEIEVALPLEVLGTEVEDTLSGYKGVATLLVVLLTGCVHFNILPKKSATDEEDVRALDRCVTVLKGPAITKDTISGITEIVPVVKDVPRPQKKKPSPFDTTNLTRRPIA